MASTRSRLASAWSEALSGELAALDERSLRRSIVTPESGQDEHVLVDGRRLTNFTSNNSLGLANDPRLIEASVEATRRYGTSVSASRLLCGSTPLHEELEGRLAALKGQERALLYSAGYLANIGVLTALTAKGDATFSDALNHASIIDGCRLSPATSTVYRHLDVDHLDALLSESDARRKLVVTESVFSMDGDLAPLPRIVEVARRHDALLVIDEAHATGVLGPHGGGALDHFGLDGEGVVVVGTLSKALGSVGGFVAAEETVVEYLLNRSRAFIFNTALPPGAVGAGLAALDIVAREPERRTRLQAHSAALRAGIEAAGYPATASETQIVPLIVGAADDALALERALREAGVLAKAVRPPTVPEGTSRLRFNLMATHADEDVAAALAAVGRA